MQVEGFRVSSSGFSRRGRPNSVRRPTRGLPVPSIPSMRTIRNTIMVLPELTKEFRKSLVQGLGIRV